MLTALNMKVTGKTINNMEKARKLGKMEVNTMVFMSTPKKKAEVHIPGLMETDILEIGETIQFMAMVFTYGLMVEFTAVSGRTT